MEQTINYIRILIKKFVPRIALIIRLKLLNKDESIRRLEPGELYYEEGEVKVLPPVSYWGSPADALDKSYRIEKSAARVFAYTPKSNEITVLKNGGIKLNNEILDLDFGNSRSIFALPAFKKRPQLLVENSIGLWSHDWGGYSDFLLFVFAKLVRIRSAIGQSEFNKSVIVYSLFNKPYERELLGYLGINDNRLFDARKFNVKAEQYYFGNNDSFYGQNRQDIYLVRNTILDGYSVPAKQDQMLYISRSGRRKVVNEQEVINVLSGLGFTIIEDKPRTVAEQIELYRNAKIIVGPHGASFTNILWCNPRTILIELFSDIYFPPYFRYLAHTLDLDYYAIVGSTKKDISTGRLDANMYIDPLLLQEVVSSLLNNKMLLTNTESDSTLPS